MAKRTVSVRRRCSHCGRAVLKLPNEHSDDTIAKCGNCGRVLGPMRAIYEKMTGQPHTPVNVTILPDEEDNTPH